MLVNRKLVVFSLAVVVAGFATTLDAAECVTPSETVCRIDCVAGTASLVCPSDEKMCVGRCSAAGGREQVARCRSGSGSKCAVVCDRGTQSLVCSERSERCRGRCAVFPPTAASLEPPRTGIQLAHHHGPEDSEDLDAENSKWYFEQLVGDVYWASGLREPPSAVAIDLWEALAEVRQGKKKSSVLEETLGGDRVELHIGLRPRQLARMRAQLAEWIEDIRTRQAARERFDREVQERTQSLLFEHVAKEEPPEPFPLTVRNRNCEGPQTFQVTSETRWLRFEGPMSFPGLRPGQSGTVRVGFDLTRVEPGRHQGRIYVECVTCPAECRVDRGYVDVYLEVGG